MSKLVFLFVTFIYYSLLLHAEQLPVINMSIEANCCYTNTNTPFKFGHAEEIYYLKTSNTNDMTKFGSFSVLVSKEKAIATYKELKKDIYFVLRDLNSISKESSLKINVPYLSDEKDRDGFTIVKTISYTVQIKQEDIEKAKLSCQASIEKDKFSGRFFFLVSIIGMIFFLWIGLYIIKRLFLKTKKIIQERSIRLDEYRVQKIAEDEAIRTTVNKTLRENDGELEKLQNLINNAVAKGDNETAKALLEILDKQKK